MIYCYFNRKAQTLRWQGHDVMVAHNSKRALNWHVWNLVLNIFWSFKCFTHQNNYGKPHSFVILLTIVVSVPFHLSVTPSSVLNIVDWVTTPVKYYPNDSECWPISQHHHECFEDTWLIINLKDVSTMQNINGTNEIHVSFKVRIGEVQNISVDDP